MRVQGDTSYPDAQAVVSVCRDIGAMLCVQSCLCLEQLACAKAEVLRSAHTDGEAVVPELDALAVRIGWLHVAVVMGQALDVLVAVRAAVHAGNPFLCQLRVGVMAMLLDHCECPSALCRPILSYVSPVPPQ